MVRYYLEWLDGEFLELESGNPCTVTPYLLQRTISQVKLHALFGGEIDLSDPQVNDSHVILHLFSQQPFRDFLGKNPTFLRQVIPPYKIDKNDQFSLATTSLRRALEDGWVSGTFKDVKLHQNMARLILEEGAKSSGILDIEKILNDEKTGYRQIVNQLTDLKQEKLLEGMLHSFTYFMTQDKTIPSDYTGEPQNQYVILKETLSKIPEENKEHKELIGTLLDEFNGIDEKDRQYLSSALSLFRKKYKTQGYYYRVITETLFHAWNTAVQRTIKPDGGSLGHLTSDSVPIGIYFEDITDTLIPFTSKDKFNLFKELREKTLNITHMNPARLTWYDISNIVDDTRGTAKKYQASLLSSSDNDIANAAANHAENLNSTIIDLLPEGESSTYPIMSSHWIWIVGKALAFIFGNVVGETTKIPDFSSYSASVTEAMIHKYLRSYGNIVIYDTLGKQVQRMKLRKHNHKL